MRKVSNETWLKRREALRRAEQSGLSLAAFARREGIAYWQLMTWKRKLRELDEASSRPEGSAFAELVVVERGVDDTRDDQAPVEIVLTGGAAIRLRRGADTHLVRLALACLAEVEGGREAPGRC